MPSTDPDRACSRFINAVKRFIEGARLQRERMVMATDSAPRLLGGTPYEAVDLTGVPGNDLDYYVYELGRLQDAAREIIKVFGAPPDVVGALDVFDAAVPHLRAARNPLTHASDDSRLDDVGWMSAVIRLGPSGQVTYLVDPRYGHHDAAEALADALLKSLRAELVR
jgi:hypothetical protein